MRLSKILSLVALLALIGCASSIKPSVVNRPAAVDVVACDAPSQFSGKTADDLVVYTIKLVQLYYKCADKQKELAAQFTTK